MDLSFLPDQETEDKDTRRFYESLTTQKERDEICERRFQEIIYKHAKDLMRDI